MVSEWWRGRVPTVCEWWQGTAVVLQQMPLRLVEIANGVADWVDPQPQTLTLNPRPSTLDPRLKP